MAAITPAPTAQDVISILDTLSSSQQLPQELTALLRPTRLALRDDATLKYTYGSSLPLWKVLQSIWLDRADRLEQVQGRAVSEGEGDEGDEDPLEELLLRDVATLGSFLASLVAGSKENQQNGVTLVEPELRRVMTTCSSFHNLERPSYIVALRACCQALSNLITSNDELASTYWPTRLEAEEQDQLLARVLVTSDAGTLQAVLIFLLNVTAGSPSRASLLASTTPGSGIIDRILTKAASHFEAEEKEERSATQDFGADTFGLAFALIRQLIVLGAFPDAYHAQSSISSFAICDSQLTLLKLLDGYLQPPTTSASPPQPACPAETAQFLLALLPEIASSLNQKDRRMDERDAAALQGVVLVVQALSSVGLHGEEGRKLVVDCVEDVTELLEWVDALSKNLDKEATAAAGGYIEPESIQLLKLSCVRLLGITAYEQKEAQDRIRESKGLLLLLGMCQINDANPTLREHALFSIRAILKDNLENQALIEGMKPQFVVAPDGSLQDLPPALRPDGERK